MASVTSAVPAGSQDRDAPFDLTELTLEDLMDLEVFSASRKEEKLFEAAAAIAVITPEDMRRAGATSIPEALRLVPGMEVARIDANKWAVSSRGFNDQFANKLLVLIDGRSVYTPLFSGVFWDTQDVLLEDVERIEVIRGPGATLWGANAVNGIINILTKSARDTQGGLVLAGLGSEERGLGGLRYGGRWREDLYYRVFAKYVQRDALVFPTGVEAGDAWDMRRGGFRLDWEPAGRDQLTLQGEIYEGNIGQTFQVIESPLPPYERTFASDTPISGGNLLGRWERSLSDAADLALQLFYDRTERQEAPIHGTLNTFDLEFQHRFPQPRQEILWGVGYRLVSDHLEGTFTSSFTPGSRDYDLISAFAQDDIDFAQGRFRLTIGSKFEHNDFTGFEIQPNIRWRWLPAPRHTGWAAISRAVRTPSRSDHGIRSVFEVVEIDSLTAFVALYGNPEFKAEELVAFELGYRSRPTAQLFFDVAAFYNLYDQLLTVEPGRPFPDSTASPPHAIIPAMTDNRMEGTTYGAELAADGQVRKGWRLRLAYTYLNLKIDLDRDSSYLRGKGWEGVSPHHQLALRSAMDLPGELELDLNSRYVGGLPDVDLGGYVAFDVRLGWQGPDNLEVSLVGQNLTDRQHTEFRAPHSPTLTSRVERGAYGVVRWDF